MRRETETIECPACLRVQLAEILVPDPPSPAAPWPVYCHECEACGYVILGSEWRTLPADGGDGPDDPLIVEGG